jgi:hypothetical protein
LRDLKRTRKQLTTRDRSERPTLSSCFGKDKRQAVVRRGPAPSAFPRSQADSAFGKKGNGSNGKTTKQKLEELTLQKPTKFSGKPA